MATSFTRTDAEEAGGGSVLTGLTLKQIAVEALRYLDIPNSDSDIANGSTAAYNEAKKWANWAARDFAAYGPWPWLKTEFASLSVSEDAYEVDFPEGFRHLLGNPHYEDSPHGQLHERGLEWIIRARANSTSTGVPRYYALGYNTSTMRHNIILHPAADGSYTIKYAYQGALSEVTNVSSTFDIPTQYHHIVQMGANGYGARFWRRNFQDGAYGEFQRLTAGAFAKWAAQNPNVPKPLKAHHHQYNWPLSLHNDANLEVSHPSG